jgi:hypothetical protein
MSKDHDLAGSCGFVVHFCNFAILYLEFCV